MHRGKYERQRKHSLLTWVLLCAALLATVIGGVSAYLSVSSGSVPNDFAPASHPEVTVDGTIVTIKPNGYAVYLRISAAAYWQNKADGTILAEEPTITFDGGTDWTKIGDFYYYTSQVLPPDPENGAYREINVPISSVQTKSGYDLIIKVAAQVVQAIGQTDGNDPVDAVKDAWGITPAQIGTAD